MKYLPSLPHPLKHLPGLSHPLKHLRGLPRPRLGRRPRRRSGPGIELSSMPGRELCSEAVAGILQRPARSALTSVGTVLGVGTFVAILGLTATASSQIDDRFTALAATEVTVQDVSREADEFAGIAFPDDADTRVERLNGVRDAGVYWPVQLDTADTVRSAPVTDGVGSESQPQVTAASSGAMRAARPTLAEGSLFNPWHDRHRQRVALLGKAMATRLGITTLETQPAIFIGDEAFTVIGIISDVERQADLLLSIVVPRSTAQEVWGAPKDGASMLIATRVGAAPQVATEAALALDPAHAESFKVTPPPDPKSLRTEVTGDLDQLFLLLAAICLFIGTIGIANTTLVAVLERTGEIGLRRALGARTRHITAQFLAESAVLGALGGLVGASIGALTVVVVAFVRDWTPVLHPATVAAAPLLGLATGLFAGLYPAWRASRIQPVEALRR